VILIGLFSWNPNAASDTTQAQSERMYAAFDNLTASVICAGLIFYGLAVASVYVLRQTRPDMVRPYKTWGYPITPALLLIAYIGTFISMIIQQWTQTLSVLALITAGVVYFIVANAVISRRMRPFGPS